MAADDTARIIELRDAIVADLNAQVAVKDSDGNAIPQRFVAEGKYRTFYQASALKDIVRVDVMIPGETSTDESRASASNDMQLWIVINAIVDARDTDRLDELVNLATRIHRRYYVSLVPANSPVSSSYPELVTAIGSTAAIQVRESEHDIYDYRLLTEENLFYSVIRTGWNEL